MLFEKLENNYSIRGLIKEKTRSFERETIRLTREKDYSLVDKNVWRVDISQ